MRWVLTEDLNFFFYFDCFPNHNQHYDVGCRWVSRQSSSLGCCNLSKLPITFLNHTNYPDCWKSTFSSLNLPKILREGGMTIFQARDLYFPSQKQKYPMKPAVEPVRPGQDWDLWEQFGKLMFDWEEGRAV